MKVYLFLADGFEEIEAIAPMDILRRADIDLSTVSISSDKLVRGAHNIDMKADSVFSELDFSDADALILPGGMPGTRNLGECSALVNLLKNKFDERKLIAAICAAPSVLGKAGILDGKEAICYPGFEDQLVGATLSESKVVKSGNIITAKGAGVAVEFALTIVETLKGKALADKIAETICLK